MKSRIDILYEIGLELCRHHLNEEGGIERIFYPGLLRDLIKVKYLPNGKVDQNSMTERVKVHFNFIMRFMSKPLIPSADVLLEYDNILQKENNFDQIFIDTADDFDEIFELYKSDKNHIYRGQGEAKWMLYNKLQRHWLKEDLNLKFNNYESLLSKLIEIGAADFEEILREFLSTNNQDVLNDMAILGLLQHYSCPTPLLDWTHNFQNALFFAINGADMKNRGKHIENYMSIYFVHQRYMQDANMKTFLLEGLEESQDHALRSLIEQFPYSASQKKEMYEHFKGRKAIDYKRISGSGLVTYMLSIGQMTKFPAMFLTEDGHEFFSFFLYNNQNIVNQEGVFTWNAHPFKPFEVVCTELYAEKQMDFETSNDEVDYKFCECLNINKSLIPYIRNKMTVNGFKKEQVYAPTELNTYTVYKKAIDLKN